MPGDREIDFGAFAAADPVALHGEHTVRPAAFEFVIDVAQQTLRRRRVFQNHCERAFCSTRVGFVTPAAAVDHLFIREDGGALGAPVHIRELAIGEAALRASSERTTDSSGNIRFAGGDFAIPVIAEAHAAMLALHFGDVGVVHS
ncbi:MAG: hypothetical protein WDO18_02275 [Acidobacteriota bacterium]